jgi:hypothetical protein
VFELLPHRLGAVDRAQQQRLIDDRVKLRRLVRRGDLLTHDPKLD